MLDAPAQSRVKDLAIEEQAALAQASPSLIQAYAHVLLLPADEKADTAVSFSFVQAVSPRPNQLMIFFPGGMGEAPLPRQSNRWVRAFGSQRQ